MPKKSPHNAVLQAEVLRLLAPSTGDSYLDVTAGWGGHASAILAKTKAPKRTVLVDRDSRAASHLKQKFGRSGVKIASSDFYAASAKLAKDGRRFDLILADLGTSSLHFDDSSRGFSIIRSGPLDMRMDTGSKLSADDIVNKWDEPELAEVIAQYGEEPHAARIAQAIIAARPLKDTTELAEVVDKAKSSARFRRRKIHPATQTFQAVRIVVNDELTQLHDSLPLWQELLSPGGRLAIISFHSLEDRIVKHYFAEQKAAGFEAELRVLTKKPITATPAEIASNPRARSAKLRVAVKIKT